MVSRGAAEHLAERGIENAQTGYFWGVRAAAAAIVIGLLLGRKLVVRVPDRVRERAVLREEQQRANEPE